MLLRTALTLLVLMIIASIALGGNSPEVKDEIILPRGLASFEQGLPLPHSDDPTPPPEEPVRAIAEWEEVEAIIFRWGTYNNILYQIIDIVADVTKAYIIVSSEGQASSCWNYLVSQGVSPMDSVELMIQATNSVWIRDYAPWWLWRLESWDRGMYEWYYNRPRPQDDVIPEWLSQLWGIEYYGIDLIHTGGNWLVDGQGNAYCSQLLQMENGWMSQQRLNAIFDDYCNLDTVCFTPMFYGINHINMWAKLLNEHTVMINEFPAGSAHTAAMDATVEVFSNMTNQYGEPWEIVRVPTPDWIFTTYSYTNTLIAQNKVVVPQYNMYPYDEDAIALFEQYMPGYEVYGINCNSIIGAGGAINCITHNIMHPQLILITHQRLPDTQNTTDPYLVSAEIVSLGTLDGDSLRIYWQSDVNPDWQSEPLVNTAGDTYEGYIPACPGGNVDYYIYAKNIEGNWTTRPRYGPQAHFTFHTGPFDLELTITPENPPIIIPANGGSFDYNLELVNNAAVSIDFDAWAEVTIPDGNIITIWDRPGLNLPGGGEIVRDMTQYVPGNAPAGEYIFMVKAGDYPNSAYAEDSLYFEKEGATGVQSPGWNSQGWDEFSSEYVPDTPVLLDNYPNPFNASTVISFELRAASYVELKVYDMLGREVASLINGHSSLGKHEVVWEAEGLGSGIYFIRLTIDGGQSSVKKVILVK